MGLVEIAELLRHSKDIVQATGTIAGCLGTGIEYLRRFVPWDFPWPGRKGVDTIKADDIGSFRKKLFKGKPSRKPQMITVEGTFYKASLLSSGWWERIHETKIPEFHFQNGLQEWLYRGFEEWAPSWDFNPLSGDATTPFLFGQIGVRDEADSLPVIISGEKSKMARENLGDKVVLEAEVTGLLYHRSQLPLNFSQELSRYGKAFDYCILLNEEDNQHRLSGTLNKRTTPYSGYLWQCWGPKNWLVGMKTPRLNEVYFLWEHTDFTKPDALDYNLDSLDHKSRYFLNKYPDLVLLQKSSSVVPGEPCCSSELFYRYILGER